MIKKIILTISLCLFSFNVFATQIIEVYDRSQTRIKVSKKELNTIHLVNDEVEGAYATTKDYFTHYKGEITGDLYFKIEKPKKDLSLFIETKKGYKYQLFFDHSYKTKSQQIILRNPEITAKGDLAIQENYKQQIAKIFAPIYRNKIPLGYEINNSLKGNKYHFKDLKIEQVYSFTDKNKKRPFHAFQYQITNKSSNIITLKESQFLKRNILAVSLEDISLLPGQTVKLITVTGV